MCVCVCLFVCICVCVFVHIHIYVRMCMCIMSIYWFHNNEGKLILSFKAVEKKKEQPLACQCLQEPYTYSFSV